MILRLFLLLFLLPLSADVSPTKTNGSGDAFQKFDEDGSDSIDMGELQNVIKTFLAESEWWMDVEM